MGLCCVDTFSLYFYWNDTFDDDTFGEQSKPMTWQALYTKEPTNTPNYFLVKK
jgi:hypothetical protein